ncbi:hypothetical protein [Stenotrophomonas maltophilia]|uniref:hypothetical protein n=1 Tax=Stenotrophomonas maltophilia TaxID=40324 RepID=UPI003876BD23
MRHPAAQPRLAPCRLFDGEQLLAAGSMYPWDLDPALAFIGVLSLAEARGCGHDRHQQPRTRVFVSFMAEYIRPGNGRCI